MITKEKLNQIIFISILVMFSSQIYMKLFVNYFNISFGIIVLIILIYVLEFENKILISITSSVLVYLLRIIIHFLENNSNINTLYTGIANFFPEYIFYLIYISLYFLIINKKKHINILLFKLMICDFFANYIEIYIRHKLYFEDLNMNIIIGLISVAFLRSTLIWIMLNLTTKYNSSLLKKEHTKRYIYLLSSNSRLKSEIYLMEKSMNNIEEVMGKSYKLYTYVMEKNIDEKIQIDSMNIAKDIHEIKKEFNLIIKGINELTTLEKVKDFMSYYEIIDIIKYMINLETKNKKIKFKIQKGENFSTKYHYYLISIFRNIIMNSIDALKNKSEGTIYLIHGEMKIDTEEGHYFKITDNGEGIEEEDRAYIFNPGFSTKIDFTTGDINRGLGLSIVKNIVEDSFNGRIRLTSIKDKGTEFTIFIPKNKLEAHNIENINN